MQAIRLLLTGGTFDKEYNEFTAKLEFDKSHIEEMLYVARSTLKVNISQLLLKDSLDITEADRKLVVKTCHKVSENLIVITHGTDTMAETALALQQAELTDKTIVLTGSMVPYSLGIKSDALFNLGVALAFVQILSPGVYIAMNGRYFNAEKVQKDKIKGVFTDKVKQL